MRPHRNISTSLPLVSYRLAWKSTWEIERELGLPPLVGGARACWSANRPVISIRGKFRGAESLIVPSGLDRQGVYRAYPGHRAVGHFMGGVAMFP